MPKYNISIRDAFDVDLAIEALRVLEDMYILCQAREEEEWLMVENGVEVG
jgi:hypothetical protein